MEGLTITQRTSQLIKKLLVLSTFSVLLMGCQTNDKAQKEKLPQAGVVVRNFKEYPTMSLATSSGKLIKTYIAKSATEQTQGLSGVKEHEIANNEAMIFIYEQAGPRSFWMPNTYTDLDIFFLDSNFKVLHVQRKVPAHPGMQEPPAIARTPNVYATHVLELKASSPLSAEIKVGETLREIK
jgi:uncharacterized membrane protein (UPF0127 family)